MKRRYRILASEDMNDSRLIKCRNMIYNVLNDPRGWKKYNISFEDCTDIKDNSSDIIKVRFYSNNMMKKKYNMDKLSAYDILENAIYFNIDNWDNGGKDAFDSIDNHDPLTRYRIYVINHEFGHSLGLDHVKPKNRDGKRGSIMMQMTKGKKHIAPCTLNEWPLEQDDFHEFDQGIKMPTRFSNKIIGGANVLQNKCSPIILLIILVILVIVIIFIKCCKNSYISNGSLYNYRQFS